MFVKDDFCGLLSFGFALVLYDFVVFGELDFVGFDHLCDFGFAGLLEAGQHLDEVDGGLEYVFRGCNDLFVLFGVLLEIFPEVELPLTYLIVVLFHLENSGFFYTFGKGFELLWDVLIYNQVDILLLI